MSLKLLSKKKDLSLYQLPNKSKINCFIASTPETRKICNDPFVYGVDYTNKLEKASSRILKELKKIHLSFLLSEKNTVVMHILRGGLNFGLRTALANAYNWNHFNSAFISSQRMKDNKGDWHISENRYQKIYLPDNANIVLGDVVATGVSLEHALLRLVDIAKSEHKNIHSITFFTIGSDYSEKIMAVVDKKCRACFKNYQGSSIIYIEGCFGVIDEKKHSPKLQIGIAGTDLLRSPAIMAPEFIASQNEEDSYALERCTIYDAGSRAFLVDEYLEDVRSYWQQVLQLAKSGQTLVDYLKERLPEDKRLKNKKWLSANNTPKRLLAVATNQLKKK